jgi:uncharacterized protein with HEPN domain
MQPESRALVWDARRAAELIRSFVEGRTWPDYVDYPMLRSAVERQFEIIGEVVDALGDATERLAPLIELLTGLLDEQ